MNKSNAKPEMDTFTQRLGRVLERIQAREEANAALQQLQATEQQLRAANQQLAASNQQLRANEQQLRASNQQLRATEQQLRASKEQAERNEKYYHTVLNAMGDPVFVKDAESRLVLVNDAFCEIFGLAREDVIGRTLAEDVAADERDQFLAVDRDVIATGRENVSEETLTIRGSRIRTISTRKSRFVDSADTVFLVGVIRDITERKEAEAELISQLRLLRVAGETVRFGGWSVDLKAMKQTWSDVVAEIHGEQPGFVPLVNEGISYYAPEYRERITEVFTRCAEKGTLYDEEMEIITRSGDRVWVRTVGQAVKDEKGTIVRVEGSFQDITNRKRLQEETELLARFPSENPNPVLRVLADGGIDYTNAAARGMVDAIASDGQVNQAWQSHINEAMCTNCSQDVEVIANKQIFAATLAPVPERGYLNIYARDITALRALENQLHQSQKLESVGRLAGGVAHDFNNLLMGIMNYVELCRDDIEPEHPIREWLDEITHVVERSAGVVRQLLAFARKQTIAPKILDTNEAITGTLKMLQRLIGEDINLQWNPGAAVPPVKMDPAQIDQIMANLCVNARDAIEGVGKITIETATANITEEYCTDHAEAIPGDFMVLTVSDDGCGMESETLANIFEPFFTTKGIGEGTGLGLATIYGIVKQNGGFVNVYSEPGQGSIFRIYLPRCEEAATVAATAATAVPRVGGDETILLVEDEKSIRMTTRLLLEKLGYTVLTAEDPETAFRLAKENDSEVHLMITDVVMPGMNGRELAAKLTEAYPRMRCLFMSGYTANVIVHRGILEENVHFLGKPFDRDQLARKVREVLDGERTP